MSPIVLFYTIYESHCTISINIYLYLQYFQQKVFSISKISGSQTNPKCVYLTKIKKPAYFTIHLIFFLLFMSLFVFFGTIYGFYCTILVNFYFYL